MARLKTDRITKHDLDDYINQYSDFSFEMKVLNKVKELGFNCDHGGTYEDPITKKSRQFDIRALNENGKVRIYLAIEIKNLREFFPLIISTVPRVQSEAFHELIISKFTKSSLGMVMDSYAKKIRVTNNNSFYEKSAPVGKSSDQVGRQENSNEIISNDSQVYDKWAQAINSSYDLIENAFYLSKYDKLKRAYICITIPILVIPDNTLWQIDYDLNGELISEPFETDHCSYFINKRYEVGDNFHGIEYDISHLEILTYSGLSSFIKNKLFDKNFRLNIFPNEKITPYI